MRTTRPVRASASLCSSCSLVRIYVSLKLLILQPLITNPIGSASIMTSGDALAVRSGSACAVRRAILYQVTNISSEVSGRETDLISPAIVPGNSYMYLVQV